LRIAYVLYWNLHRRDGVAKKIRGQVDHWRTAGHDVEVFCVSRGDASDSPWRIFPFRSFRDRYRATQAFQRAVVDWLPDVAYLRFDVFLPPVTRMVSEVPTVAEIQTVERAEMKLRRVRSNTTLLYNEVTAPLVLARTRGLVCVTHEIAEQRFVTAHGKPTIVIGNGIDLERVRALPPAENDGPHVVFLASVGQAWHGVDKILWMAEQLPDVTFHFVGYRPEDVPGTPPPNLIAHGVLTREEYEPILARCDAGIGTLALHRLDMYEASTLKVREYLGYGLPLVLGYEDTDLAGLDPWWKLQLPNEESNVRDGIERIREFFWSVRGRRVPRAEIADRIGAHVKERKRVEFLSQFAEAAESAA
jgi:glycosyltransferase involved in cell wall biosynthesis